MTGCDHETNAKVTEAAAWLRDTVARPSPIIPNLCRRFGLSPRQACEAIAEAERRPVAGHA